MRSVLLYVGKTRLEALAEAAQRGVPVTYVGQEHGTTVLLTAMCYFNEIVEWWMAGTLRRTGPVAPTMGTW